MRDVHHNVARLEPADARTAERRQAIFGDVAAAKRIPPVPCERHHAHPVVRDRVEALARMTVVGEKRRTLHREHAGGFSRAKRAFDLA